MCFGHKIELYMGNILVLNYHEILKEGKSPSGKENKFAITHSEFIRQLDLIREKNIPIMAMSDWLYSQEINHDFAVVLTFDGGFKSDYELVYPVLKERKISATFFPVVSFLDDQNRLNWNELKEMSAYSDTSGTKIEIGSHGVFNQNMRKMRRSDCKLELELSKRLLEKNIGTSITLFAPPQGIYNRQMLKLAFGAGYKKVFSTHFSFNSWGEAYVLHRWNIKRNTTLSAFEKMLEKGREKRSKKTIVSRLRVRALNFSDIGLINGIHLFTNQIFQNRTEWK